MQKNFPVLSDLFPDNDGSPNEEDSVIVNTDMEAENTKS